MQKLFKRLTVVLAAVLAVVCLGVFAAACTDDNSNKDSYTVTVQYEDGTPVDGSKTGMQVQICIWIDATKEVKNCYGTFNVGTDGKATVPVSEKGYFDLPENTSYHWQVNGVPEGYTYEEHGYVVKTPQDVTIVLKKTGA